MQQLTRRTVSPTLLAGVLFGAFALVAAGAGLLGARLPDLTNVLLFGALVCLSENVSFHFPTRINISPANVLVFASLVAFDHRGAALGLALVYAAGGLGWAQTRAGRYRVIVFNVAQLGLTGAATAASYQYLDGHGISSFVVYPAAVVVYLVVNSGLVFLWTCLTTQVPTSVVWADVRSSLLSRSVLSLLGLLLGRLYLDYHLVVIVVIVAVVILGEGVLLAVARLRQAYTRLDHLYRFTQGLERSRDERDAIMSILGELRKIFDAGTAELTLLDGVEWRRTVLGINHRRAVVTSGVGELDEIQAVAEASILVSDLPAGDGLRASLVERAGPDAMAVALRSEQDLIGSLVVGHAQDRSAFSAEDVRLLEALANHAVVSLENSRLLGQLRYDSHHDHLTGLPNRTRFNELITDLPKPSAILLVDLDRFKEINDTLGHQHGDLLLMSVARRISDEIGHRGIVSRLGGDEFGVLLPQTGSGDAAQTAVSLLAAVEQPFQIGELELEITASIGVAVAAGDDAETSLLLQRADVAMYSAKESHSGWELYSSERDHYSPRRLTLAGELRRAIETGELEVHYQPKADLQTRRIQGVEALVRWRHPRYGVIGPDQFIPVAESAGLIRPLTAMVLDEAVSHQRALRLLGYDLAVAINLSVRSVLDVNLPDQVAAVLAHHGVSPSALTLEITEGSVMADPARTIGILGRLAELGTSISVDDFGTGYSSLSYLKRLPAAEVKIDRTFVAGMLSNRSDRAIVRSTVDLARNLGLRAVAEGVEDAETWDALAAVGCDYAQGYYISPPLPMDEFRLWLLRTQPAADPLL